MSSKLQLNAQQAFEQRRAELLGVTVFPNESIPENFKKYLHKALMYVSIHKCGVGGLTWKNWITFERPMYIPEATIALEVLKGATPIEMEQELAENLQMLIDIVEPMARAIQKIDYDTCLPIKNEMEAKLKASANVPIGHEIIKM